ncbi:hypothetical protein GQ53DRAFT_847856 [Thozetella sp. PMI_491]|nr:hypothetical protein GQ53DRAFT_847856 [Thozetella sp. PMI_491]
MKLLIALDRQVNAPPFQPNSEVRGNLEISGCKSKHTPPVMIIFRGTLKVSFRPQSVNDRDLCPKQVKYTLFQETIRPELEETPNGDAVGVCTLGAPFAFNFPTNSQCHPGSAGLVPNQLPPSLDINKDGIRIKSEYWIIARVERGWLSLTAPCARQKLAFSPIPSITPLPVSSTGLLPAYKLAYPRKEPLGSNCLLCDATHGWLPEYSPAIGLDITLHDSPLLTNGDCLPPLHLVVRSPSEVLQGEGLYIRNITVQLRSTITVRASIIQRTAAYIRPLWCTWGFLRIETERFALDPGIWGTCCVPISWPTFSTPLLEMSHSLEATLGLSKGTGDRQQVRCQ